MLLSTIAISNFLGFPLLALYNHLSNRQEATVISLHGAHTAPKNDLYYDINGSIVEKQQRLNSREA